MRTSQCVAYSTQRTDSSVILLTPGWGAFIGAGTVALYYLGHAFWLNKRDRTAPDPSTARAGEGAGQPEPLAPEAGA
ncbi:hypothetical protein [Streptomyces katsurahamanus]|uniref:Uncharacterized protein n=1 Tax=Streptomyces katsurahamanus TaxID=2577098 RepID=A0ABW9NX41_9ACTN|nr:hypothetical protein [Streptomyces katsurahamanus]MQS37706.1 hypothetical protein [Streptomyces katsurahamanus]